MVIGIIKQFDETENKISYHICSSKILSPAEYFEIGNNFQANKIQN
jgi:hypothetical protein